MARWIESHPSVKQGKHNLTLYTFPHAGSGARSYLQWAGRLQTVAAIRAIQLPGRETRIRESAAESVEQAAEAVACAIAAESKGPFVLFGHSFGSLIVFEVARYLRRIAARMPELIIVSGTKAPHVRQLSTPIHELPNPELIEAIVQRYDGFPPGLLRDPEALAFFAEVVRADIRLLERYRYSHEPPLPCPIEVYAGERDQVFPRALVLPWREQTSASYNLTWFDGGHLFPFGELKEEVLSNLERLLKKVAGSSVSQEKHVAAG